MLNALEELIPWLRQWHNDLDPTFNERMGDYYESFLNEEIRSLGTTITEVQNPQPRHHHYRSTELDATRQNSQGAKEDEQEEDGEACGVIAKGTNSIGMKFRASAQIIICIAPISASIVELFWLFARACHRELVL